MRTIVIGCLTASAVLAVALAACKREEPAQNPQGYQQVQPGYAQPGQTAQPGYYQQQPTAQPQTYPTAAAPQQYPQTAPAPTPAAAGTMNPNPTGLACTSDAQCLTHRCNTAVGKCSFPCLSAADCNPGMQCAAQFCVPVVGAAPAR
jgi:hypothetical protein